MILQKKNLIIRYELSLGTTRVLQLELSYMKLKLA